MDLDQETPTTDECFVTALQIFDYCGGESTGTLRVDALMEKFAPFVKTNKAEFGYLKTLLDPEQSNPEIDVTRLTEALHKYSESQKTKVDLDESFNKSGQMPQDSDSGISTDGFQLLEELQSELREKAHLAHQLRSQLDFTDRQHEEALATLTAEKDSLRAHLNMLREENMTLNHVRRDYEEACDRLCASDQALENARRELDSFRKRTRVLQEQVSTLEMEKLTLQELLTKSKDECHRINEMYASRQCALLEQNETLRTGHADLSVRLQDQEDYVQQIIKEKVLLEMELKDMLNKSNQTQLRLDRSIDVSYTDDQMLTALDTLNADSRFAPENQLLEDDACFDALKEDQGRATNMSLFDEIRLSFNITKHNNTEMTDTFSAKFIEDLEASITVGTQTDAYVCEVCISNAIEPCESTKDKFPAVSNQKVASVSIGVQTTDLLTKNMKQVIESTNKYVEMLLLDTETKTELQNNNNNIETCEACPKCLECVKLQNYTANLESDLKHSSYTIAELKVDLNKYEANLTILQSFLDESNGNNTYLQTIVRSLESKICILEAACSDQNERINNLTCETCVAECQTEIDQSSISTQVDVPCFECEKRNAVVPHRSLRKYLWEPLKCLFQVFAIICFLCAVSVLYGVTRRWNARCERDVATVPWRWFDAQDLLDLFLRIEYVADVPM